MTLRTNPVECVPVEPPLESAGGADFIEAAVFPGPDQRGPAGAGTLMPPIRGAGAAGTGARAGANDAFRAGTPLVKRAGWGAMDDLGPIGDIAGPPGRNWRRSRTSWTERFGRQWRFAFSNMAPLRET